MKAAYILHKGPPENILFDDLPQPAPSGRQVLVRVGAVAVNPIDIYVRSGAVNMGEPMPFILGCDLAGVVEALGPEATRHRVGDRVWGSNQGLLGRQGTFAEFAAVDEAWLYPTPPNVPDESVAALALVGITTHLGLVQRAQLQAGETLLVNGGSGGIGTTVIQVAKALGARVIATVRDASRIPLCRDLGADEVLVRQEGQLAKAVKALCPDGVNVWWETSRAVDFDLAVGALARRGRLVLMAGREARPPFPVGPFYVKDCSVHGFAMFNASADTQRAAAADLDRWLAEGRLRPRIDRVLPLAQAAEAHRLQERSTLGNSGELRGKLVLQPRQS